MLDTPAPAVRDRFADCIAFSLYYEGGYSNHPRDKGGRTMRGITQRVYDGFRDASGLARQSVEFLSDAELLTIYRRNYWNLIRGDELPPGINLCAMDFCLNSGPTQAIRSLQGVLGLERDGHLGQRTLAAIMVVDAADLVRRYMDERRRFLRSLADYAYFGRGWETRCNGIQSAALAMAGTFAIPAADLPHDEPPPREILAGHEAAHDADYQAQGQGRAPPEPPLPPWRTETMLAGSGGGGVGLAISNACARVSQAGRISVSAVIVAIVSEPFFWLSVAPIVGACAVYFYRKALDR